MKQEIQDLEDVYLSWLKEKINIRSINQCVEITTPFLDRHNDYIQIYALKSEHGYTLTDDGYTITDLEQSGCSFSSQKRLDLLKLTLNGFGVKKIENRLEVQATKESFSLHKHNLVQSILAVNDMFYLSQPLVTSLFYEDVADWLESQNIRALSKVKFAGKSGLDHQFDFAIPKSKDKPERFIKAINNPSKDNATSMAFAWLDTKEDRPPESRFYGFLNDTDHPVANEILEAMLRYDVQPVLWSMKSKYINDLAA